MTTVPEAQYWLERDGDVRGPYSFEILTMMWARKELRLIDRLRKDGTENWIEVTHLVKSLDRAADLQSDKPRNPRSFVSIIVVSMNSLSFKNVSGGRFTPSWLLRRGIMRKQTKRSRHSQSLIVGLFFSH